MSLGFSYARVATFAAAACISLTGAPQIAAAQSAGPDDDARGYQGQDGSYYDPCRREQVDRSVVGGVLGAVAGATLGNSVTHGGAKLGGAIIGGTVGAAAGAGIGHASAACDSGQPVPYAGGPAPAPGYGDPAYAPPPAPPPPGAYVPPDYDRYAARDDRPDYAPPPPPRDDRSDYAAPPRADRCQMVEDRVFFPDGTTESSTVRACRDDRGRWRVAED